MKELQSMFKGLMVLLALTAFVMTADAQLKADPKLPDYKPVSGVSGSIKSVGSDTMNNMMALWAEGFKKHYPSVSVEIEGKGSSTAPPALISGAANFGPMSRAMKEAEIDEFEKKFGYQPIQLPTSLDVLAVYVNKDNPVECMSLPKLDAIFSKNRLGGYPNDILNWGQAGLTAAWVNQPIGIYGRNAASGTYGFFKEHTLFGGDYKDSVKEQPGSSSVVQGVASDKYGIGYSGIGYKTADVKAIAVAEDEGEECFEPDAENAYTGDYPLSRYLFLSVNYKPGSQLDPLRREFIKYVFSKQGQEDIIKDGYFPISADLAKKVLARVGIK